jgi:hypothetical protein
MGCYDSFSFVTFSLPASEWTVTKTGGPPDDHSTPSHHGPSSSHRRHVTVVALDHALHGGGGLGGCRERSPPDVVFPRGHKHKTAQTLLDLQRFFNLYFCFSKQ